MKLESIQYVIVSIFFLKKDVILNFLKLNYIFIGYSYCL
jgi:hypothetical protein